MTMQQLSGRAQPQPQPGSTTWSIVQPILTPSAGTPLIAVAGPTTSTMSATAPSSSMSNRDKTGFDTNDPLFRRLVAGISYSRRFALTYYYLVLLTVAVFAISHLITFVRQRRAARRAAHNTPSWLKSDRIYSSLRRAAERKDHCYGSVVGPAGGLSSSGTSSPTLCDASSLDENSPLLKFGAVKDNRSFIPLGIDVARSWLVYQPASPGFICGVMPTNAVSAFICFYLLANIFYLVYNIEFSVPLLFVLSDRAAVLFVTNLPVLYLLSAKNQPLQPLIGYSHAALNILHRRLGEWMCFLASLHGSLMFVVWITILRPKHYTFARFMADRVTITGLCALACFLSIFFTSLRRIRRVAYELFLACHVLLQIGALAFLYFHHSRSRPYVLACLAVWFTDRVVCRLLIRNKVLQADLKVLADGETVKVSASVGAKASRSPLALLGLGKVTDSCEALDHVFLRMPSLGWRSALQSHPFSLASLPSETDGCDSDLSLIIRANAGFTCELLKYARNYASAPIHLDGPYGSPSALRMLRSKSSRLLVAGGSGIAVIWPLMQALLREEIACNADVEVGGLLAVQRSIVLVWVVHSVDQYSWIENSQMAWIKSIAGVNVVLPAPTGVDGRPDLVGVLREQISNCELGEHVGVVCSGPDGMARDVRNGCASMVREGRRVCVEVEKYGW